MPDTDYKLITGLVGIEVEFPMQEEDAEDVLQEEGWSGIDSVGYNHDVYTGRTVIKHDSSCGVGGLPGCELVSPPTSIVDLLSGGSAFLAQVRTLREFGHLNTGDAPRPVDYAKCGIHVHVGLLDEVAMYPNSDRFRRRLDVVWRSYSARSAAINSFCGANRNPSLSRHASRYCGAHLALSDKYGQINASPVLSGSMSTIEFRQLGHTWTPHVDHPVTEPTAEELGMAPRLIGPDVSVVNNDCPPFYSVYVNNATGERWRGLGPSPTWVQEHLQANDERYEWDEEFSRRLNAWRLEHGPESGAHTLHPIEAIAEWALFVMLLTEASAHRPGWIISERDATYGPTNPLTNLPWAGQFWTRPVINLP